MSCVTAPAAEQPSSTSAPVITSASVRVGALHVATLGVVEPVFALVVDHALLLSQTKMFCCFAPSRTNRSRQAIAAAPALLTAIFTAPSCLPVSSMPLMIAAAEMIAVPCWSSWNTGIFSRSFSRLSMVKHLAP